MKLGNEELRYMRALETVAGVSARDCIIFKNKLVFIINAEGIGKAIGKKGSNVKKLSEKMGKNIELMEYSNDAAEFVKKALGSIRFEKAEILDGEKKAMQLSMDFENRKKLLDNIGRLKKLKEIVKREYNIGDIRVR
ncbi:MAG: NusA-like transcription termination signal-binding factor [Candidatus Diapherotrites archaeon]|uniref:NusA-like transcription termination signal-binding factor n=1 Tax=Candidatus Iainarchaeum sp. TaxID=3101447 RepID=A0A7J4KSN8_9ARCH|nr:MAG: N utilization substance protein A [archaeon GW2011_AR21]MBS3058760.1 NusA-like transcription termination signal-binding factor [Candidatus Diapherotrites archaeon]HIH21658.1 NusA-like transcription termination signal-binding factor [Candidatus Diapherotrites archaeon]HIH32714.1 NusA-like transcription termination signal-binding factor [Candidatus Diapherotrites archaeon]